MGAWRSNRWRGNEDGFLPVGVITLILPVTFVGYTQSWKHGSSLKILVHHIATPNTFRTYSRGICPDFRDLPLSNGFNSFISQPIASNRSPVDR